MNKAMIGEQRPDESALKQMKERGGEWFAYQNHDLGHRDCGHLKFLKCGKGCTYEVAPSRMPDTDTSINWRYVLVGKVDLEKGEVNEIV